MYQTCPNCKKLTLTKNPPTYHCTNCKTTYPTIKEVIKAWLPKPNRKNWTLQDWKDWHQRQKAKPTNSN